MARMHTVSPASGFGGGTYVSDAELMHTAISNHDMKKIMSSTAMGTKTYGSVMLHGPAVIGGMLTKTMQTVPKISGSLSRAKRLLHAKGLLDFGRDPTEPLMRVGSRANPSNGIPSFHGFLYEGTCAGRVPNYTKWSGQGTTSLTSCIHVYTQMTFDQAWQIAVGSPTDTSGTLVVLQDVVGNTQRVHRWIRNSTPVAAYVRQLLSDPKHFQELQPTPYAERQMETEPRRRVLSRMQRLAGYQVAGREIELRPDTVMDGGSGGGKPPKDPPWKPIIHRNVPSKERKTKFKVGPLIGGYHTLTEINDLFDALADAIPGNVCGHLPGFAKMACVVNNWDKIDPVQAAINVAANEIEDRLVGRLQGKLADALKKAGGPNSTQVQQFSRQLRQLLNLKGLGL